MFTTVCVGGGQGAVFVTVVALATEQSWVGKEWGRLWAKLVSLHVATFQCETLMNCKFELCLSDHYEITLVKIGKQKIYLTVCF